ncbi:ABC transporter ATP-binding protein [Tenggerimyces flavus]|uniref:ABC transporter ATP-binding protein n=1 Tax=Tenggerimyces flavus TaxID=1708749 RepID=A0ABV7Y6Z1_9ACTN|nr:ABC transporter ATP-binding protein [Tenggerimyces flavus]MBM7788311.1 ABC-type multidrug transport system ATPase subunit [Tenggerimyces flavus]
MIELADVHRTFDTKGRAQNGVVRAVDGVTLSIERGEVLGLLGHNGAGKTTVVRLIAGVLTPTKGKVRVDGQDPVADGVSVRRRLGVLPTGPFLDLRLTARANLRFAAELFGVPRDGLTERIERSLAEFDLTDRAEDRVEGFSAGMRQRLALARVLLPEPEVLLLDEPSAQLDPLAVRMVRELIARLSREAGRTVVLCTHDLVEAQLLCDRVVVLDHGRVAAAGTPAELSAQLAAAAVEVEVAREDAETARDILAKAVGADAIEVVPGPNGSTVLRGRGLPRHQLPELVGSLAAAHVRIYGVRPFEPSLEDVYLALYAGRPA